MPLTQIVDALEANDIEKLPVLQAMLAFMRKMVSEAHYLSLFSINIGCKTNMLLSYLKNYCKKSNKRSFKAETKNKPNKNANFHRKSQYILEQGPLTPRTIMHVFL